MRSKALPHFISFLKLVGNGNRSRPRKKISSIFNNTLKRASAFRCAANSAGIRVVAAHVREEMTEMVFGEILILRLAKRFFLKRDTIDHSCQINSRVRMRMNWIINPIFGFRHFQKS